VGCDAPLVGSKAAKTNLACALACRIKLTFPAGDTHPSDVYGAGSGIKTKLKCMDPRLLPRTDYEHANRTQPLKAGRTCLLKPRISVRGCLCARQPGVDGVNRSSVCW
jgi:hypothetical protein